MNVPALRGRPTTYTEEHANRVLDLLAEGQSLKQISDENPDLPKPHTVIGWTKTGGRVDFAEKYAHAREIGYSHLSEQILEIADNCSDDIVLDQDGNPTHNHASVQRARLMVDTRKWMLSKMLPKVYGDRVQHDHAPVTIKLSAVAKDL